MNYKHPRELPKSRLVRGFSWTSEHIACPEKNIHGDTHPTTWAADNEQYASAGDPGWALVNGKPETFTWGRASEEPEYYPRIGGVDFEVFKGFGKGFQVGRINDMPGLMGPGGLGPKPSGLISVDGSLFLSVQTLLGQKPPRFRKGSQHGSDASILRSDDFGKTWYPDIQKWWPEFEAQAYNRKEWRWITPPEARSSWNGWQPMFPGNLFGGPTFIQYGRDNADAVDNFVYAVSTDQWDNGSEMRLGRVPKKHILDRNEWEWAMMGNSSRPDWTKNLQDSQPVLVIDGHIGLPEMIYLPRLKRYLLLTWGLHKDFSVDAGSELTVLEAENPWGPFSLVYYEELWDMLELCPYCPRIPLKGFDQEKLSGWLVHSGNWMCKDLDPWYRPFMRSFKLVV